jgi:dTDP-4-amino-4,6-dideoxygalactose transaminase
VNEFKVAFDVGYDEEEIEAVASVLKDGRWAVSSEQKDSLIREFCEYFGVKYAIPTSSGTGGLCSILAAFGVGPGDEVITAANSHISPPTQIMAVGAKPVLVDVEEKTLNIDTSLIKEKITSKTKALMPVHSAGHPFDVDPVVELAEKYDLRLIHDAAQSMGAKYKGKLVGRFPDVTLLSFATHKHVCIGGAGMILTDDEDIMNAVWAKVHQGSPLKTVSDPHRLEMIRYTWGYSYRMIEVIAALTRVQFKKFREGEIRTPVEKDWAYHSYCRYIIQAERRDELFNFLTGKGIELFIHYLTPLNTQPFLKNCFGYREGMYPVTEETAKKVLTLPSWPYQTAQDVDYVVESIKEFYSQT